MFEKTMKLRTAVILCGGKGTRLGLIGKKMPKTLVQINGRPILWYILNELINNKFNHFILPIGHKGEMIKDYIKNVFSFKKYKIEVIKTGINSSISKRINKIKNKILSNNFILLNGDAIFSFNLNKIYLEHLKKNKDITFLISHANLSYGVVNIKKNKIINFERETRFDIVSTSKKKNIYSRVYSGLSVINKKVLKSYNFEKFINFEKEIYPRIIKKNNTDYAIVKGFWFSIDNIKDIEGAKKKNNTIKFNTLNLIKKKYEKKFLEK
jgi:glucose-1-phosphate cytidylyltransferase